MDRSISLQAATDAVKGIGKLATLPDNDAVIRMSAVEYVLFNLPSAQSEIIRCKDCKYSERWYRDKRRCFLWHETGIDVFEDGYCNYAERRADGSECGKEN